MTTYTATFSNGEIKSRNSKKEYSFCWAFMYKGKVSKIGFSVELKGAENAVNSYKNLYISETKCDPNNCDTEIINL